jgi:hypothetical protein
MAYQRFWDGLKRGECQAGEYRHIGKHGRDVWVQATYNPILRRNGKPFKVIAFATDITARIRRAAGATPRAERPASLRKRSHWTGPVRSTGPATGGTRPFGGPGTRSSRSLRPAGSRALLPMLPAAKPRRRRRNRPAGSAM